MCWEACIVFGCGCTAKRSLSEIERTSLDSLIRFNDDTLVMPCDLARDIGKVCPHADCQPHQEWSVNVRGQCIDCLALKCEPSDIPPEKSKTKKSKKPKPRAELATYDSEDETDDGCSKHDKMMAFVRQILRRKQQQMSDGNPIQALIETKQSERTRLDKP